MLNGYQMTTRYFRKRHNFAKRKEVSGADASRIRWRRIANVNETIEIRSLVSQGPQTILR